MLSNILNILSKLFIVKSEIILTIIKHNQYVARLSKLRLIHLMLVVFRVSAYPPKKSPQ